MPRHPQLVEIGKNVRKARKALQERAGDELARQLWSQDGFATEVGIARSYYGGVERGERNLSLLKFLEILTALDAEPSEVLPSLKELKKLATKRAPGRRNPT